MGEQACITGKYIKKFGENNAGFEKMNLNSGEKIEFFGENTMNFGEKAAFFGEKVTDFREKHGTFREERRVFGEDYLEVGGDGRRE